MFETRTNCYAIWHGPADISHKQILSQKNKSWLLIWIEDDKNFASKDLERSAGQQQQQQHKSVVVQHQSIRWMMEVGESSWIESVKRKSYINLVYRLIPVLLLVHPSEQWTDWKEGKGRRSKRFHFMWLMRRVPKRYTPGESKRHPWTIKGELAVCCCRKRYKSWRRLWSS